ncbi:MAG: leucine-rich repeat domain-containing protein [Eubacterium sp.]
MKKIRNSIKTVFILALSVIMLVQPMSVSAATYSGKCGDNVTWTLNSSTGALTISGTGAMETSDHGYNSYSTSIKTVTISYGVTSICYSAFSFCKNITSISIPNSVTSIGFDAFYLCESLKSITIPNSVTSIGNWVFNGCSSLTSINVNSSNQYYSSQDGVLFNKNKTELIRYPEGKTETSYTIPSSITNIGECAFDNCESLTNITIPNSVTSIAASAFRYCRSLKSIKIPNSVTTIDDGAFYECTSLTSIVIPNKVTKISYCAFCGCKELISISIPSSVTTIESMAFYHCGALNNICYAGTSSQWKAISIDSYNNEPLINANIHYNHSGLHSYTSKTTTSAYLKSKATCTSPAVYYYKCSRCSAKGTKTYKYGSALGHSYKNTSITKATTSKNGKKLWKCSRCGTSKKTIIYYPKTIKLSKTTYTYDGKAKKPSVTVKDSKGNTLKNGTDYTVSYSSGRKELGTYTVKVTFKGKYSGKKSLKFKINLGKVTGLKQKPDKGIYFKWNKVIGATGYDVYTKTSKNGSYKPIKRKNNSKCQSGKKTKGTAYFKVRAYRIVKGKKIVGPWSDVKKFRAK